MGIGHVLGARGQVNPVLATGSGAAALTWWNPDGATPGGVGGSCVGAYQAKGAADYATSLVNLANPGTYNLTEGNGAVAWAAGTGWTFTSALLQYFDTGIDPASQANTSIAQFSGINNGAVYGRLGGGESIFIRPAFGGALSANGGLQLIGVSLATGNYAMAGTQAYRNGLAEGGAYTPWGVATNLTLWIGDRNGAVARLSGNVLAVAFYNIALTAPQVLARATAMAAL